MIERFTQGKLRWVNLKRPTKDEVKKVVRELDLPPSLVMDLTQPVPRNIATSMDHTVKVTVDLPTVKSSDPGHQLEVKFLVTKRALVTVHYEEVEGLDRFREQFEITAALRHKQTHLTGAHLFVTLFHMLYESASSKLDYIEGTLSDIEDNIFNDNERQMVYEISETSKKLIAFRHVIVAHDDIYPELGHAMEAVFGKAFEAEVVTLEHEYSLLRRRANSLYKTMTALRDTNSAMLNTKQNEIMKIFTIMAFTTFPLTLFSSMFGMNTENTPLIGHPFDFWVIVGIMVCATVGFFAFFKHKGWM